MSASILVKFSIHARDHREGGRTTVVLPSKYFQKVFGAKKPDFIGENAEKGAFTAIEGKNILGI